MALPRHDNMPAGWTTSYNLQDPNLSKIDVLQLMSSDSSSLRFVPNNILEDWQSELKRHKGKDNSNDSIDTLNDFINSGSHDVNDSDLIPTLIRTKASKNFFRV